MVTYKRFLIFFIGVYLISMLLFHFKFSGQMPSLHHHSFHYDYTGDYGDQMPSKHSQSDIIFKKDKNFSECPEYTNHGFQKVSKETWIYSAYLDTRYNKSHPYLRLMVVTGSVSELSGLVCSFRSSNIDILESKGESYTMCENHNRRYGGYIVSCQLPKDLEFICEIQIKNINEPDNLVTVPVLRIGNAPKKDFAICIPPLWGVIEEERLIEFVELSRILGAQKLYFYIYETTIPKVLDYYKKRKIVEIVKWNLPIHKDSIWYFGQIISINDCLYRTMGNIKHVAFNDVDEFIIPRIFPNWWLMTRYLWRIHEDDACGFSFQSVFFLPTSESIPKPGLLTTNYHSRSKSSSNVRTKCMVRPERVFEMGIHHISKQAVEEYLPQKADVSIGLVNHYRRCMGDFGMECSNYIEDNSTRRYEKKLERKYFKVLKELNFTKKIPS